MTNLDAVHDAAVAAASALVAIALEARAAHGVAYDVDALEAALETARAGEYEQAYYAAARTVRPRQTNDYRADIHAAVSTLYRAGQTLPWKRGDAPLVVTPALHRPIVDLVREFGTMIVSGDRAHTQVTTHPYRPEVTRA